MRIGELREMQRDEHTNVRTYWIALRFKRRSYQSVNKLRDLKTFVFDIVWWHFLIAKVYLLSSGPNDCKDILIPEEHF